MPKQRLDILANVVGARPLPEIDRALVVVRERLRGNERQVVGRLVHPRHETFEGAPEPDDLRAFRICSSAPGSSMVVRSHGSRPSQMAWIERRSNLPERFLGNSATKHTCAGPARERITR